jgi:myo-inositol 2-dehydrogenase/D-chiro-inositol 1-dehydrogenase
MMRLGLLGSDARIAEVAAAAVRRGDRLVAGFDVPEGSLGGLQVPPLGSWDRLLDAAVCDAVLVGADGWDDSRAQAVRTLVQAGRPLVLAQPLELSMLWAYELDMIRRDTGSLLVPCLPDRLHPFIMRLQEVIAATLAGVGDLGTVESLHFERRLIDRSRTTVLAQLSRDADLVRALAGDPARLSTLGGPDPDSAWSTLAVGLTGPTQLPVRWQVAPAGDPGLTIRLQATQGSIVIEAPDDASRPWTWTGVGADRANFDRGATVLGMLDAARGNATEPAAALPAATWADAARAIELAETVPRSLARGRSIDLHREEFTEMGTFRGTMASLGCGLIMLALMVIIFATLVAGVAREFGWSLVGTIADSWPAIVLGALGLFLLLQLLPLLIGATGRPPGADRET